MISYNNFIRLHMISCDFIGFHWNSYHFISYDFMISLDDGSAPTFGTFGDGFTETVDKLKARGSNRDKKLTSYVEEEDGEE